MPARRLPLVLPAAVAVGLGLSGCAAPTAPSGPSAAAAATDSQADPWENANRSVFDFNNSVNHSVLFPVSKAYTSVVPPPVRTSVHNFLENLDEPIIFANDVLQAQPALAAKTFGRAAINTTVGVGGMFDVATKLGIPYHTNDLGVTLATWGVPAGPYVMMPILGPSNVRDLAGQVGDSFGDPGDYVAGQYHYVWAAVARSVTEGVDTLSRNVDSLQDLEKTSLDYYATIRSLYGQRRAAQIRHEQSNLPNPGLGGGDAGGEPAISYTTAPGAPAPGAPAPLVPPRAPAAPPR